MKKIRVIVVDDSALIRQMFTEILNSDPDIEVIAAAVDPYDAREKIKALNPDVITLDIEMPNMDGISFLEKIMSLRPMPVVMVSTLTKKGADVTLKALELGAVDYIPKPTQNLQDSLVGIQQDLISKVKIAAKAKVKQHGVQKVGEKLKLAVLPEKLDPKKVIAIGASTGGVEALREVIPYMPVGCPPIIITQHMPPNFTKSFATRLNSLSQIEVHEAEQDQPIKAGNAYIAPGGRHLEVKKAGVAGYRCFLTDTAAVSGHRPSVDVMFASVAELIGKNAVGVILTGMGKDGTVGMMRMKSVGCYNIGQDENSSIVYGMPKAAYLAGVIDKQIDLKHIPQAILDTCSRDFMAS